MAGNFGRVNREALHASQTPFESNESTPRLSETTVEPTISPVDQPTWQQQEKFSVSKGKNRKWKKLDKHARADNTRDKPTVPSDSPDFHSSGPASSSLHPPASSTPKPPASDPSHTFQKPRPHRNPRQHNKKPNTMKVSDRAFIPPHIRNQARNNTRLSADGKPKLREPAEAELPQPEPTQSGHETANGRPKPPLSPPTSPAEEDKLQPLTEEEERKLFEEAGWGWDDPKPEPPPRPKKRHNSRWPSPVRARPKHVWPKARDMKPRSTDDESDGGVGFKSDSEGDPHYDVKKLIDWNGDWLPPPESWTYRNQFQDRHFGASIEKWINGHDMSCTLNLTDELATPDYQGREVEGESVFIDDKVVAVKTINKEIAPRSWIPSKIEGDAPQHFWRAFPDRAPTALSNIDITENRPYWEEYPNDGNSGFINPPEQPLVVGLDPEDEDNRHPGVGKSATEYLIEIAQKKQARNRRHEHRRNRPDSAANFPQQPMTFVGYRPTTNVYFRPVKAADAKGIRELYNYYAKETISVPEFNERTLNHIIERISTITDEGLPYIVAVAKGNLPRGKQDYVNERIVGIAFIDDFCDKGSMYRFTFELELYVHPGFVRQGIAKCLLDRLLEMVNTSYQSKCAYEWVNRGDYLKHGSARVVKVINVTVPHAQGENVDWITEFMRKFKFRKAGHLFKVGFKLGKV
ncbi:hypothetical protein N0V90_011789 [Kalmusia sp. IMI 367209]|nr:hypothetical protein N0V90_011789 [Kalmusia sp. IMI 367209]